ncbi:hypothetical protein H5410_011016 [Solanum commersonii]|uniref:Uncharacterized protein n=1 Tax=Solanum commersonii TaxID=4109 RepID=A0A9J6AMG6_SOLCO|nr:hypothetical protein H5410_011016 [Solanum commersonii]
MFILYVLFIVFGLNKLGNTSNEFESSTLVLILRCDLNSPYRYPRGTKILVVLKGRLGVLYYNNKQ